MICVDVRIWRLCVVLNKMLRSTSRIVCEIGEHRQGVRKVLRPDLVLLLVMVTVDLGRGLLHHSRQRLGWRVRNVGWHLVRKEQVRGLRTWRWRAVDKRLLTLHCDIVRYHVSGRVLRMEISRCLVVSTSVRHIVRIVRIRSKASWK